MEETMSKKQKIIVSLVGIFLVLITLIGITYAYFVTQIQGNTNDADVIISAANLMLRYTDGNGLIEPEEKIMPGTTIESKTFSVENLGTLTIENYGVYIENILNEFERPQDLKLTLRCEIFDLEESTYLEDNCNGLTDSTYPIMNSMIVSNSIDINTRHDYTLIIEYKNETEIDQSNDMNKTIKGKIQIHDNNDSINITGEVTNAAEGDYVVLGDNKQISRIVNGEYKIVGLAPDYYTLHIKNDSKDANGNVITTNKGSLDFMVEKGAEIKIENNILYTTENVEDILLNLTNNGTTITLELVN